VVTNPDGGAAILASAFTYYDESQSSPPVPVSIVPGSGSALGDDLITVGGLHFVPGLSCYLCGSPADDVKVLSTNQFTARTPPGAGACDIEIVNPDGQSGILENGFTYLAPEPALLNVVPGEGPLDGGIEVVLYGDNFMAGMVVWFGVSQSPLVTLYSNETASAVVPAGLPGKVNVKVVNPGGPLAVLQGAFEYKENPQVLPPPAIEKLVPATGPITGATVVNIQGTDFQEGAKVFFSGTPANAVSVLGPSSILATTPPMPEGFVDVTVLNSDGQGTTKLDAFEYVLPTAPPPKLFGVVPPAGPQSGSTSILVTGQNLTAKGMLYVNFQPVAQFTFMNDSVLSGLTPPGEPGTAVVSFVGEDGQETSLQAGFTYIPAPKIESISPKMGPIAGETEVTIVGKNFQPGAEVYFGALEATSVQVENALILHVVSPATEMPGKVDITIVSDDGQSGVMQAGFEYLLPPSIDHISPAAGPEEGGTPVSIWGADFSADATILFGDAEAGDVKLVIPGLLLCTSPAGTGAVNLTVTNPDTQQVVLESAFEYLPTLIPAPELTEVNPAAGPETGGTLVTLSGTNLEQPASILMGTLPVTDFAAVTSNQIVFVTPVHEPGVVDITFVGTDGQSAIIEDAFQYIAQEELEPPPTLLSLEPVSGPTKGSTIVVVSGGAFQEDVQVYFGNKPAPVVTLLSPTELSVTTPAQLQGLVDVTALNPDGQVAILADAFTFVPPPVLDDVIPDSGTLLGGDEITISGSGFWTGETPSERSKVFVCLDFAAEDGCQQVLTAGVVSLDETEIIFVAPPHLPGFVDIGISNPDGQKAFVGSGYYYNEPPVLEGIDPTSGPAVGGTTVTVTGSGFMAGMVILFGDTPAAEVTPVSAEQVLAVTPPGTHGLADVTVINPDTTPDALGDIWRYYAAPEVTSMYPTSGPEDGGTTVTLEGNYFWTEAPGPQVFFGGEEVPADDIDVLDGTLIQVITPPGSGPVAVTVVNADGQQTIVGQSFVFVPPADPPVINYLVPSYGTGSGGEIVSVVGTGFLDGAQVFFGTPGSWVTGTNAAVKNVGTMITVITPEHAVGVVDVRVLNSNQLQAIADNAYEFTKPQDLPPLEFTTAMPDRVPVDGNVQITISGKGFEPGVQVFFGTEPDWVEGAATQYLGPTILHTIVPESPTGDTGTVDIRLLNPSQPGNLDEVFAEDALAYTAGGVFEIRGIRIPPDNRTDGAGDVADFNNDGLQDVLVLHKGQGEIYTNTMPDEWGFGGWFQKQTDLTNWNAASYYHAHGDFDGDGDIDIMERRSDRAALQLNNGDGTFADTVDKGVIYTESRGMTAADLNCDGYLDVFVASYSSNASRPNRILVNNAKTSFTNHTTDVLPAQYEHTRMAAAADVDLDGDIDLLLANDTAMQNRLYYNNCANIPHPPTCYRDICTQVEYNDHVYAICTKTMSWEDARDACEANGYYLAVIDDQGEQNFLTSKTGTQHWIGYSDLDEEGDWQWIGGNSNFTYWGGGQPDNAGGDPGEDCAVMRWWGSGQWNDTVCTSNFRYICETELADQCPAWKFTEAAYGPGKNFPVSGFNTRWAALVDLDENGYADAVMANWEQNSKVYMNYGGNFEPDDYAHFPQDEESPYIKRLYQTDIDLDGDTDIIASVKSGDWKWLRVYVNDLNDGGSGALVLSDQALPDRTADTVDFAVADFDGDLLPDIWVVNKDHQDQLLINDGFEDNIHWDDGDPRVGEGGFSYNSHWGMPEDIGTKHDVVGDDIDGDGDIDVIKANWHADRLTILINQGDGTLADESEGRSPVIPGGIMTTFNGMKLADMNGDGHLDIVMSGYRGCDWDYSDKVNTVRLLLNDGSGYFTDFTEGNIPYTADYSIRYLDTGDLNSDGKPDIFVAACSHCYCYSPKYQVLINGGDPFNSGGVYFFNQMNTWLPDKHDRPNSGSLLDLNDDGLIDLYLGRGAGGYQNRLYLNSGSLLEELTNTHLPSVADDTYRTWVYDFDGDGDLDLYSVNWGQDRLYLQEVNHTFSDVTTSNVPTIASHSYDGVIGDFDGDGTGDMFVINYDQKNELYLNQGNGILADRSDNLPWDDDWGVGGLAADFDLDGDLDVYVTTSSVDRMYINIGE
jgi:hypothetical protein